MLGCDSNCSGDEGKDVYTLNLFGPQMINLAFVVLLTRFTKIGKKDSLLMYPNARVYLMNYIKMDTLRCRMSYRRLKN